MSAPGFKPVGWVAAVAVAALGCYMTSLQVASERAELANIEHRILRAQQDIRTLQTELGTRGRLSQLERWNAEVLALSAPTSGQFLDSEVTLARFDVRQPTIADQQQVRMASAAVPAPPAAVSAPAAPPSTAPRRAVIDYAAAADAAEAERAAERARRPVVQRAALVVTERAPEPLPAAAPAPRTPAADAKPASLLDDSLIREIGAAARAERQGSQGN
ncbi:MAG: hypothetical protein ACK4K7_05630 [Allosphingosinicella sp.]|uniref:hypothetical protein n=1 Tax=Allosphingosinicella sp. TaxID=2823234 RepID=UPI00392FF7C1